MLGALAIFIWAESEQINQSLELLTAIIRPWPVGRRIVDKDVGA